MPQFNREELAWAAGLFDGEGTIGVRKNGNGTGYRRIGMAVKMTDKSVVERFASILECRVRGPYTQSSYPNSKPVWSAAIENYIGVMNATAKLWPWLSTPKKLQAKNALLRWYSQNHRKGRPLGRRV